MMVIYPPLVSAWLLKCRRHIPLYCKYDCKCVGSGTASLKRINNVLQQTSIPDYILHATFSLHHCLDNLLNSILIIFKIAMMVYREVSIRSSLTLTLQVFDLVVSAPTCSYSPSPWCHGPTGVTEQPLDTILPEAAMNEQTRVWERNSSQTAGDSGR